ncbi:MAG: AMP-binding protein [Rhodocyclaceae bacterium]|nr:AMP-binding protein [Rhodocyclaceae bacterium]
MNEIRLARGTRFEDTALHEYLQTYGCADLAQLHLRAVEDPQRFWAEAEDAVGLRWTRRYRTVCDLSAGPMWPRWFVGGEIDLFDNLVGHIAREDPQRPAVTWEGEDGTVRQLDYRQLDAEARRLAAALSALGIRSGDRIALYLPMVVEAAVVFLAAARLGAMVLPLFSGYGADAVAARLRDSEAAVMVCADGYLRRGRSIAMLSEARAAAALAPALTDLVVVPRLGTPWSSNPHGHWREWDYRSLVAAQEPGTEGAPHPAETPLMIVYTSGTTGRPKGVVHTHTGFPLKAALDMLMAFDLKPRDRILWVTDMGWMMGPWLVYGGLLRGATLVFSEGNPDHPAPDRIWQLVARHRLTHLGLSPTLARLLMAAGEAGLPRAAQLDSLRVFGSTGEPWNDAPWRWLFDRVGDGERPIINYSGGTEIGGGILTCFAGLPQKPCGFAGPIPGMQVDVLDTEGASLIGPGSPNEVGELVLRAPWPGMAHGFWRDPERYLDTYWSRWAGTWVHGDWARVDSDGHWFIDGRSDDTLKIAGKRVGPAEYESALVDHSWVAEAVAIGVPDAVKGEVAHCFVTLRPAARDDEDWQTRERTLIAHVAARLGKPLAPARVVPVAALPRTRNGKILRRLVRAVWLDQAPGDLGSLDNPGALDALRDSRERLLVQG